MDSVAAVAILPQAPVTVAILPQAAVAVATLPQDCVVCPRVDEQIPGSTWNSNSPSFHRARQTFLVSGVCSIPNALPKRFAQNCFEVATNDRQLLHTERQQRMQEIPSCGIESSKSHHLSVALARCDFAECVERDGARFDVRLDMQRFLVPAIVYNPIVFPLVQDLLGGSQDGINLLYAGIMWADPQQDVRNAVHQKWHGDGGHCFDGVDLPPHAINVFYNLIDVSHKHGPTQFVPGTHKMNKFNDAALNKINFSISGEKGSVCLFDYRIKHRGGANISANEARPVLYLCYARNWFRDSRNLRSARSIVCGSIHSPMWKARILTGCAMPFGKGFETVKNVARRCCDEPQKDQNQKQTDNGSGERWVLFHMDVELGDGKTETIVVYSDDVAKEVSTQFCLNHDLDSELHNVLSESIQQQMNAATKQ